MTGKSRPGFTLIEAILALSLSSFILAAVFSMLLSQGRGIDRMDERAQQLDQTRGTADLFASEIADLTRGSILAAASDSLTIRLPISWGVVCGQMDRQSSSVKDVKKLLKLPDLDTAAILLEPVPVSLGAPSPEGFALSTDGITWSYYPVANWTALNVRSDNRASEACTGTKNSNSDYKVFPGLAAIIGREPDERGLIMTFVRITYAFRPDPQVPGGKALFRNGAAGSQRLAGPYTSSAAFKYRLLNRSEVTSAASTDLPNIASIRVMFSLMNRDQRSTIPGPALQPWFSLYNSRQ